MMTPEKQAELQGETAGLYFRTAEVLDEELGRWDDYSVEAVKILRASMLALEICIKDKKNRGLWPKETGLMNAHEDALHQWSLDQDLWRRLN